MPLTSIILVLKELMYYSNTLSVILDCWEHRRLSDLIRSSREMRVAVRIGIRVGLDALTTSFIIY